MLRSCMAVSKLAQRQVLLLRTARAFSSEVKTRVVKNDGVGPMTTTSREDFERAFPGLAAKQKHHIRMVKEFHLPVHRSGGASNDTFNYVFYGVTIFGFVYTFYLFYVLISKS